MAGKPKPAGGGGPLEQERKLKSMRCRDRPPTRELTSLTSRTIAEGECFGGICKHPATFNGVTVASKVFGHVRSKLEDSTKYALSLLQAVLLYFGFHVFFSCQDEMDGWMQPRCVE